MKILNKNLESYINNQRYGLISRISMLILNNNESIYEYRQGLDNLIRLHPTYTYVASLLFCLVEYGNAISIYTKGLQIGVQTSENELIIRLLLITLCLISLLLWIYFIKKNSNSFSILTEICTVSILMAFYTYSTLKRLLNMQKVGCKNNEFEYLFIGLGNGWRFIVSLVFIRFGLLRIIFCSFLLLIPIIFGLIDENQEHFYIFFRGLCMLFYVIVILIILEKIRYKLFNEKYISKELHKFIIKEIIDSIPENIMIIGDNNKIQYINSIFLEKFGDINDFRSLFPKFYDIKNNIYDENNEANKLFNENNLQNNLNEYNSNAINNSCTGNNNEIKFPELNHHISTNIPYSNNNFLQVFQDILLQLKKSKDKNNELYVFHGLYDDKDLGVRTYEIKININLSQEESLLILIIRDITNTETIAYLKDTIKYKNNLLSSFSHELRTPLNYQINYLEAAINDINVNENVVKSYIMPVLRSTKLLKFLIKDILDLSSINNQTLVMDIQPLSISKTIKECIELIEFQATKKNIKIDLIIENDVVDIVSTDHEKLAQIIINLLVNAMKFSIENGIIQIYVNNFHSFIQISIHDNGIGMTQDKKIKLKSSLNKHISTRRNSLINTASIGMGLQISNLLALLLGPHKNLIGLEFESEKDKGTTFSFIIQNKMCKSEKEEIDNLQSKDESPLLIPRFNMDIKYRNDNHDQYLNHSKYIDEYEINLHKHCVFDSNQVKSPVFNTMSYKKYESNDSIYPMSHMKINLIESSQDATEKIIFGPTERRCNITFLHNHKILKENCYKPTFPATVAGDLDDEDHMIYQISSDENQNKPLNDLFKIGSPQKINVKLRNPVIENSCKCPEILIVDDDSFNILSMECLLKKLNYTFLSTYNGELAIAEVLKRESQPCSLYCQQFKLIFMDCSMPIMDGMQATKIIKAKIKEKIIRPIKIIAYTAFVGSNKRKECMEAGMDNILSKPTDISQLKKILANYITQVHTTQVLTQKICIRQAESSKMFLYANQNSAN